MITRMRRLFALLTVMIIAVALSIGTATPAFALPPGDTEPTPPAPTGTPDLVISSVTRSYNVTFRYYEFRVTVKNQGTSAAGYSRVVLQLATGPSSFTSSGADVSSLAAGASKTVIFNRATCSSSGYAIADNGENVRESNESNNLRAWSIAC